MALGLTAASALAACSPAGPTPTAATPVTPASEPTAVPVAPTADPISANVTVKTYVNALVNGDFTAAWDLLAPATQRGLETAEAFAAGRRLFMDAAGNRSSSAS